MSVSLIWRKCHQAELAGVVHLRVTLKKVAHFQSEVFHGAGALLEGSRPAAIDLPDRTIQVHVADEVISRALIDHRIALLGKYSMHLLQLRVTVEECAKFFRRFSGSCQGHQSVQEGAIWVCATCGLGHIDKSVDKRHGATGIPHNLLDEFGLGECCKSG